MSDPSINLAIMLDWSNIPPARRFSQRQLAFCRTNTAVTFTVGVSVAEDSATVHAVAALVAGIGGSKFIFSVGGPGFVTALGEYMLNLYVAVPSLIFTEKNTFAVAPRPCVILSPARSANTPDAWAASSDVAVVDVNVPVAALVFDRRCGLTKTLPV